MTPARVLVSESRIRTWFWLLIAGAAANFAAVRADEKLFEIPGQELRAERLAEMYLRHWNDPVLRGAATLWDQWLVGASIWHEGASGSPSIRDYWRQRLLSRPIDREGYVGTCQHLGAAHADGWPFPLWQQASGIGYHFTLAHNPYLVGMGFKPTTSVDGWQLHKARVESLDDQKGLVLSLDEPGATITTPPFDIDSLVAPWICIDASMADASEADAPWLAWQLSGEKEIDRSRRVYFTFKPSHQSAGMTMIPIHRHLKSGDRMTRLMIAFDNRRPAKLTIRALHTAIDSRHNINNSAFVLGCMDYIRWTGELAFLRESLPRMRTAIDFAIGEFDIDREGCVHTRWVGHDGRTGLGMSDDGKRIVLHGRGIGSNYWDLLPFGSRDSLASFYIHSALRQMAELERTVSRHPEWNLPQAPNHLHAERLDRLADQVRLTCQSLFWSENNGRFVACIDQDSRSYDYGYSFVNLEAIHYGVASPEQAKSIFDWLDGRRLVDGDTSQGKDIYHFRFAPRASTKRNIEWYCFAWTGPETIPFGGQVQDGGAVLGFSYHDVMARLRTQGADDAWTRLASIADWFDEVQKAGGYRAYYADPAKGTLQGGGPPGGLGVDHEFIESILVPTALVDGFAGIHPSIEALAIAPNLPPTWERVRLRALHVHDLVLDCDIAKSQVTLTAHAGVPEPLAVRLPAGRWRVDLKDPDNPVIAKSVQLEQGTHAWTWDTSTHRQATFTSDER